VGRRRRTPKSSRMRELLDTDARQRTPTHRLSRTIERNSLCAAFFHRRRYLRLCSAVTHHPLQRLTSASTESDVWPGLYHDVIFSPVSGFTVFSGSKLSPPSERSWKSLPEPWPRSSLRSAAGQRQSARK
jgi:hypothetical protein